MEVAQTCAMKFSVAGATGNVDSNRSMSSGVAVSNVHEIASGISSVLMRWERFGDSQTSQQRNEETRIDTISSLVSAFA